MKSILASCYAVKSSMPCDGYASAQLRIDVAIVSSHSSSVPSLRENST